MRLPWLLNENILSYSREEGLIVEIKKSTGKIASSTPIKGHYFTRSQGFVEPLPRNHWLLVVPYIPFQMTEEPYTRQTLIKGSMGELVELGIDGKTIWSHRMPSPIRATGLHNGNFLVESGLPEGVSVIEINRSGQPVWEVISEGKTTAKNVVCLPLVRFGFSAHRPSLTQAERIAFRVKLLRDSNAEVRRKAVSGLQEFRARAEPAIPILLELLDDPDPMVCRCAGETLWTIGPIAIPALMKEFRSPKPGVRADVATLIVKFKEQSKEFLPALTQLLRDKSPKVRISALRAIGYLGQRAKDIVPEVAALLSDMDLDEGKLPVAGYAVMTLRDIGVAAKGAVPALAQALKNGRVPLLLPRAVFPRILGGAPP